MTLMYADWINQTKKFATSRSKPLKEVDKWFKTYEDSNYTNKKALENLSDAFKTWSNTKQKTETKGLLTVITYDTTRDRKKNAEGKGPVGRLREFITSQAIGNIVVQQQVTGLTDRVAIIEIDGAEFTQEEGRKLQEAINMLQSSLREARDTVIAARQPGDARNLYVKWFGAFDEARWRTVRDRFQVLDNICSKKGIVFNDGRGDLANRAAFAWAYPGEERNFPNMWLGDAFFTRRIGLGRARDAVSGTLGTLIHELTHACFRTGDVPVESIVDSTAMDEWGSPVNYGAVDVCNDPKNDCRLADRRPALAIMNADNYGEFVVDVASVRFTYSWP